MQDPIIIEISASVLTAIHRLAIEAELPAELYARQLIGEAATWSDPVSFEDLLIEGERSGEPQTFDRDAFREKMNVLQRVRLGEQNMPDFIISEIPEPIFDALRKDAEESEASVEGYAKKRIMEAVNRHMATLDQYKNPLAAARARGVRWLAELLSRKDMLTVEEMAESLGISAKDVDGLHQANKMLGVAGSNSETKYPEWQVNPDGTLIDGLEEALAILGDNGPTAYRILCEIFPDGSENMNYQCLRDGKKWDVLRRLRAIARGDFV